MMAIQTTSLLIQIKWLVHTKMLYIANFAAEFIIHRITCNCRMPKGSTGSRARFILYFYVYPLHLHPTLQPINLFMLLSMYW